MRPSANADCCCDCGVWSLWRLWSLTSTPSAPPRGGGGGAVLGLSLSSWSVGPVETVELDLHAVSAAQGRWWRDSFGAVRPSCRGSRCRRHTASCFRCTGWCLDTSPRLPDIAKRLKARNEVSENKRMVMSLKISITKRRERKHSV